MLQEYPKLKTVTDILDRHLVETYPLFFGPNAQHPVSRLKPYKVVHDNLWGTNRFSWLEMAVIDTPIFQRLRYIHQTGLAFLVYPTAHHTRFEHSLGVVTVAGRTYDALVQRHIEEFREIAAQVFGNSTVAKAVEQLRSELRLAALLHDVGHSLHSHTSEVVYQKLSLLEDASIELSMFAGQKKGAGEVLSFCVSRTPALEQFLMRASSRVDGGASFDINLENVSLLIIGRSRHPLLQFMADIVSSELDADKLDYLVRDATFAGLPLKYDLERFLYTVKLAKVPLPDGDGQLHKLYTTVHTSIEPKRPDTASKYPYFEALRLRLPKQAMSTIEQIVICKFMLFSYIYHHKKVRAAEGLLSTMLERWVANLKVGEINDAQILRRFLNLTDPHLEHPEFRDNKDPVIQEYTNRICMRLLPRLVFGFVPNNRSKEAKRLETLGRSFLILKNELAPRHVSKKYLAPNF